MVLDLRVIFLSMRARALNNFHKQLPKSRTTPQRVELLTMRTKQGINRGQELDETSRISSFVSGCDVVGGKNYLHHSTNYFYPENDV